MKTSKSFKGILTFLFSLVVIISVFYNFFFNDIANRNRHASVISHDLYSENNNQSYLTSAQRSLEESSVKISQINGAIVEKDGDVKFIETLEAVAKQNSVVIDIDTLSIENDPKLASTSVTSLKVRAKSDGSWANTYKFLADLEAMPFRIKVNKFTMTSSPDAVSPGGKPYGTNNWESYFEIKVLKYK